MMQNGTGESLRLTVVERLDSAGDVAVVRLEPEDGRELPPWLPGAHLEITLPSGLLRQYSLCGDPADRSGYRIAVRAVQGGRGGSLEFHREAVPGKAFLASAPKNNFALAPSERYLLVGGGIGITPLLPMARALAEQGAPFRFLVSGRERTAIPLLAELEQIPGVEIICSGEQGRIALGDLISELGDGTAVYCCGPETMLNELQALSGHLAEKSSKLHVERFTPNSERERVSGSDTAIEVVLRRTGKTIQVGPGETILACARSFVPGLPSSCEEGYCGTCETRVLEGIPDHRDDFLEPEERESNETMMICVGRSKTPRLVLDI